MAALANVRSLCDENLAGRYAIEVVDLLIHPERAAEDQILALPTLIRKMPEPIRKLIGNLADGQRVLAGLDLAGIR